MASRRIANRVCTAHPSAEDINRFEVTLRITPSNKLVELLPVFYHLVDTARIPDVEQLETCSPEMTISLTAAVLSLAAIFMSSAPQQSGADLWPRVWAWAEFLSMYGASIRALVEVPSDEELHIGLIKFCAHMCKYLPTKDLIISTPGTAVLAVRAWMYMVDGDDFIRHQTKLFMVLEFLGQSVVPLEDVLEGAGRDISDVAHLLMRQCKHVVRLTAAQNPVRMEYLWLLEHAFASVAAIDNIIHNSNPRNITPLSLFDALVPLGFVNVVAITAYTLSKIASPRIMGIVKNCILILNALFSGPRGDREVRVAVQNGLLHGILACARRDPSDDIHPTLRNLLANILTPATVHYYALEALRTAYLEATNGTALNDFSRPDVREGWTTFERTLRTRLDILSLYKSKGRITRRACDNLECGIILEKTRLKRCSGCREALYCSPECQALDWQSGHRECCTLYFAKRTHIELSYTSREYSFLRFLLHHDYVSARPELYKQIGLVWASQPNVLLCTTCDYRSAGVKVELFDVGEDSAFFHSKYERVIHARASHSSGRVSLNIMRLAEGTGHRDFVIPIRRTTSEGLDSLKGVPPSLWGVLQPRLVDAIINDALEREVVTDIST
ncbi:hypothetical protein MVEN_00324300 [Mycena venus]|uniref:MYND-type domain-containing protein n=1 Tax=Mycena venus TaxID=2733690 RepID=A0A8H6YQU9_9AGAR|nr:hypothetical protein MVEN_00324300 [Mycena venus]